jgi:hypothetical protein
MANRAHAADSRRWGRRVIASLALLVVVGATFAYVTIQLFTATNDDLATIDAERRGVAYLQPLNNLIGEITIVQSAAVRGLPIDASKINAAITAVDTVDAAHGGALDAHQRWGDLRDRVRGAITESTVGQAAYSRYSDLTTVALELAGKVGDTSELILDPALDSYYLMDTALLRVPAVYVGAGRAADLAVLGGASPSDAALVRVAVARHQVAIDSEAVAVGVRKAMENTDSARLGPNLTGQLDAFRSAVDAFVPPVKLLPTLEKVATDTLVRSSERVRQELRPLGDATLRELDALLRTRHDALIEHRAGGIAAAVAGVVLAILLLGLMLPAAPRPTAADDERAEEVEALEEKVESVTTPPSDTTFLDPRDLLAVEELLHVGRAVRTRRRERVDDAG